MHLLAGDIGGTKTNLAIYSSEDAALSPLKKHTFPSGEYDTLESMAHEFLEDAGIHIESAGFGVAGPVIEGRAKITNLPWEIDSENLQKDLGLERVVLLNDLEAIAYGVPHLAESERHTLNEGNRIENGTMAVIAPGTGLGEAFLTWSGDRYAVHASEGGHTDFGPTNARQLDLLRYLLHRYDHVSYERICSGIGLPNIYAFLRDTGVAPEPDWLKEKLAGKHDPTPIIVETALAQGDCVLCTETLKLFVEVLGAETGNLALKMMATGGVYLAGGIPPRILPRLGGNAFRDAFLAKGRFNELLSPIPVHVIMNPEIALIGAAHATLDLP